MGYDTSQDALVYLQPREPEHFTEIFFILKQKVDEVGEEIIKAIIKDAFERYISFHPSSIRIKEL